MNAMYLWIAVITVNSILKTIAIVKKLEGNCKAEITVIILRV